MNVLSLFDGISCGQIALNKADIKYDKYFASEIDKNALKVTQFNYPKTIQLGDVRNVNSNDLPKIDLLIGGSPCQTVSLANQGGSDIHSGESNLFFEFVRLLKELNPKYFLLENVPMSSENKNIISKHLDTTPIEINSSLVSIQNRKRLYWTNIDFGLPPKDKHIYLKDVYDKTFSDKLILRGRGLNKLKRPRNRMVSIQSKKTPTLMKEQETKATDSIFFKHGEIYRYPTRRECELMQTVPIGYTDPVNYRLATGLLGNGWTVDIIAHIFSGLKKEPKEVKTKERFF